MRWIEKQARYCQGYLADECTLIPVAILLANAVAVWLLTYLDPVILPEGVYSAKMDRN